MLSALPTSAAARHPLSPSVRAVCYLPDPNWTRIHHVPLLYPPPQGGMPSSRVRCSRTPLLKPPQALSPFLSGMEAHTSRCARHGVGQHAAPGGLQLNPSHEASIANQPSSRSPDRDQLPDQLTSAWLRSEDPILSPATANGSRAKDLIGGALSWMPPDTAEEGGLPSVPPPADWHLHPALLSGCEAEAAPLRVAVLLSGGVDSSLALRLLQAAGHSCTAFYLQIWFQEDFRNSWDACPWEEDLHFCRQVCEAAGVPLEVVPLTDEYWDRVVSYLIAETRAGRTPNPDVLCNSRVKFGAFQEYLEREHGSRFDRIASGHYARALREQPHDGEVPATQLALTTDDIKDQTYFLAHLSQRQLSRVMFPLGPLTKPVVRQLAAAAQLANQTRKDSQGICFLGKVRHSEFLRAHLGEWPGPIIEEETNEVVGYHRGFWFHTVGQRKGVPLSGGPWYCVRKDTRMNAIYISRNYFDSDKARDTFRCGSFNWVSGQPMDLSLTTHCKVRHGPVLYDCTVVFDDAPESRVREYQDMGVGVTWGGGAVSNDTFTAAEREAAEFMCGHHNPSVDAWSWDDDSSDGGFCTAPTDAPTGSVAYLAGSDESMMNGNDFSGSIGGGVAASSPTVFGGEPFRAGKVSGGEDTGAGRPGVGSAFTAIVTLGSQDQGLAPGQFAVFYQGDICMGSAVILEAF